MSHFNNNSDNDYEDNEPQLSSDKEMEYIMNLLNAGVISEKTFNEIFGFNVNEIGEISEISDISDVSDTDNIDNIDNENYLIDTPNNKTQYDELDDKLDDKLDDTNDTTLCKNNDKKKKKKKNKCSICRKKLGLMPFKCNCGKIFCAMHRYAEEHNCNFDYKTRGREKLLKDNPKVVAEKIIKI